MTELVNWHLLSVTPIVLDPLVIEKVAYELWELRMGQD